MALGIHLAGFQHELLVDSDGWACATLRYNAEHEVVQGIGRWDVLEDRVQDVYCCLDGLAGLDLIAAGVSCQPFSNGGKRLGHDDERSMFPAFTELLVRARPRAFVLENVDGLATSDSDGIEYVRLQLRHPSCAPKQGEHWRHHLARLLTVDADDQPEYMVRWEVLNAADYGVPQQRKRVFFVGFRVDVNSAWVFPEPTHSRDSLIHDQWVLDDCWRRHGVRKAWRTRAHSTTIARVDRDGPGNLLPWRTLREAIADLPTFGRTQSGFGVTQHVRIPGARSYPGHTGSLLDLPAKSLKAGVHGVPGGKNMLINVNGPVRYFTIRECARIQTFPDTWTFEGPWSRVTRQLGNAVPVQLARIIALSVRQALINWDSLGEHGPCSQPANLIVV